MSYSKGSEKTTGYIYEPWHYRFIDINEALEWRESELVLEEFLATKPQSCK